MTTVHCKSCFLTFIRRSLPLVTLIPRLLCVPRLPTRFTRSVLAYGNARLKHLFHDRARFKEGGCDEGVDDAGAREYDARTQSDVHRQVVQYRDMLMQENHGDLQVTQSLTASMRALTCS